MGRNKRLWCNGSTPFFRKGGSGSIPDARSVMGLLITLGWEPCPDPAKQVMDQQNHPLWCCGGMVTQRSAKPFFAGSSPVGTSYQWRHGRVWLIASVSKAEAGLEHPAAGSNPAVAASTCCASYACVQFYTQVCGTVGCLAHIAQTGRALA